MEGRQQSEWAHTAAMLAQIANVGCFILAKRPRTYKASDFNPTLAPEKRKPRKSAWGMLALKVMTTGKQWKLKPVQAKKAPQSRTSKRKGQ